VQLFLDVVQAWLIQLTGIISEYRIESEAELALTLADDIEAELNAALAARGCASLVVSGGRTPQPLFEELARRQIAWNRVTVTLADERWWMFHPVTVTKP
jgi:6-phosphogluconolactonase/glucosamine-6-phosphate isomerase/deaminase